MIAGCLLAAYHLYVSWEKEGENGKMVNSALSKMIQAHYSRAAGRKYVSESNALEVLSSLAVAEESDVKEDDDVEMMDAVAVPVRDDEGDAYESICH
jgi:hypothetical protein